MIIQPYKQVSIIWVFDSITWLFDSFMSSDWWLALNIALWLPKEIDFSVRYGEARRQYPLYRYVAVVELSLKFLMVIVH